MIHNDLQALIVGTLVGALMGQQHLKIIVEPNYDDANNYLPEFIVTGRESGTRLRVSVEVIEE